MAEPLNTVSQTWDKPLQSPDSIPESSDIVIIGGGIVGVSAAWFLAVVLSAGMTHGAALPAAEASASVHLKSVVASEHGSVVSATGSEPRTVVLTTPARPSVIQDAYSTMFDWVHGTLARVRGGFLWARSLLWTLVDRAEY